MKQELLNNLDLLIGNFDANKYKIETLLAGVLLDEGFGNAILYSGSFSCICSSSRENRIRLYDILLNKSRNLNQDTALQYKLFREAYIMTDNIYAQLQQCSSPIKDIQTYIADICQKVNAYNMMSHHEKQYYDNLPTTFTIYRGMSQSETNSKLLGISWTNDKQRASNYVYYTKNNVPSGYGVIAETIIQKKDILTIYGADGLDCEIIVSPSFSNVKFVSYP